MPSWVMTLSCTKTVEEDKKQTIGETNPKQTSTKALSEVECWHWTPLCWGDTVSLENHNRSSPTEDEQEPYLCCLSHQFGIRENKSTMKMALTLIKFLYGWLAYFNPKRTKKMFGNLRIVAIDTIFLPCMPDVYALVLWELGWNRLYIDKVGKSTNVG